MKVALESTSCTGMPSVKTGITFVVDNLSSVSLLQQNLSRFVAGSLAACKIACNRLSDSADIAQNKKAKGK